MASIKKKDAQAESVSTSKENAIKTLIYIGPTVSSISLINYRIFRGGLSAECDKLLRVVPGANILFVQTSDFAMAEKRLADKTSVESVMYSRVLAAMKEIK